MYLVTFHPSKEIDWPGVLYKQREGRWERRKECKTKKNACEEEESNQIS